MVIARTLSGIRLKGRTIRKVMGGGGGGNFRLARIFFSLLACAGIFFAGETLCTNFFQTNIAFLLNSEILIHYLCFCTFVQIIILHSQQMKARIQATF